VHGSAWKPADEQTRSNVPVSRKRKRRRESATVAPRELALHTAQPYRVIKHMEALGLIRPAVVTGGCEPWLPGVRAVPCSARR